MKIKNILMGVTLSALSLSLLAISGNTARAEKVINQHSSALSTYSTKGYKVVNNVNNGTKYDGHSYDGSDVDTLNSVAGYPVTFNHYESLNNHQASPNNSPQGLVLTPDAKHAYVAYNDYNQGMNIGYFDFSSNPTSIKQGSVFNGGHGQSFTYNYKTGQLWLIGNKSGASQHKSCVEEISKSTLQPIRKINFSFGQSIISTNLAFDNKGNAYTYTITGGGFAPKNSIKLYKGKITNNSVKFHLVKQGIRYAPGVIPQGMSYNPANNRLYLLSDGEITSFPANKIGHLSKSDVRYTKFAHQQEFEGLYFDRSGYGYLLLHENILKSNKVF